MNLDTVTSIADLQALARRRVPKMFYDYADSGSYTESTYRGQHGRLRQVSSSGSAWRSISTTGRRDLDDRPERIDAGGPCPCRPDRDAARGWRDRAARAANAFGVPFTLSTMSICSIEEVAKGTGQALLVPAHMSCADRGFAADLVKRAKAANCSALVLTLDLQVLGQRHKDIKNGLSAPPSRRSSR